MSSSAVITRDARIDDHAAYARLHDELGVPDAPVTEAVWRADAAKRALVIEADGTVVGYGLWAVYGETAHVQNVVVGPSSRGQRLGGVIMRGIAERVRARGASKWFLNVKEENVPAIRLYERFGMSRSGRGHALGLDWEHVAKLPTSPTEIRDLRPSEDAAVEARFGMAAGMLAGRRSSPRGYVLRAPVSDDGIPLGVAASTPAVPGAAPFRVARAELARPLIESLHSVIPPTPDGFMLWVESDESLAALLRSVGARVYFVALQMRGPLPDG
jgi:GNAT superfamily N-acetyltransferase